MFAQPMWPKKSRRLKIRRCLLSRKNCAPTMMRRLSKNVEEEKILTSTTIFVDRPTDWVFSFPLKPRRKNWVCGRHDSAENAYKYSKQYIWAFGFRALNKMISCSAVKTNTLHQDYFAWFISFSLTCLFGKKVPCIYEYMVKEESRKVQ